MSCVYHQLEGFGIDEDRLREVMDGHDNYGALVHAFETVTVLSVVLACWPEDESSPCNPA